MRLVEGDNLQFLLPRVALPSKLYARATWCPVKGGLQNFQLDPHEENYFSPLKVSFSHTLIVLASEIVSMRSNNKIFTVVNNIIRVNKIHCPMRLTMSEPLARYALNKIYALIRHVRLTTNDSTVSEAIPCHGLWF